MKPKTLIGKLREMYFTEMCDTIWGEKIPAFGTSDGSVWGYSETEVQYKIKKTKFDSVDFDDDDSLVFVKVYTSPNQQKHGMVYTSNKFLKKMRKLMKSRMNNFIKGSEIDYTEAMAQGKNYVYMRFNTMPTEKQILKWAKKEGIELGGIDI